MVEIVSKERVPELNLEQTKEQVKALQDKIEAQGGFEEGERELKNLLTEKLEALEGSTSSGKKFEKWDKEGAKKYLETIKDKSRGQIRNDRTGISAIQVLLGVKPDWILGKRTKSAVKKFQKKNGLAPDWKPWPNTVKALLWLKVDNKKTSEKKNEPKVEEKSDWKKTIKDDEWNVYEWTVGEDGKFKDGTYTRNDGKKYTVKNGDMTPQ